MFSFLRWTAFAVSIRDATRCNQLFSVECDQFICPDRPCGYRTVLPAEFRSSVLFGLSRRGLIVNCVDNLNRLNWLSIVLWFGMGICKRGLRIWIQLCGDAVHMVRSRSGWYGRCWVV